jgi:hypothetical protein
MKRSIWVLLSGLALLAGCNGASSGSAEGGSAKLEMRVYPVPPDNTEKIAGTLNNLLRMGGDAAKGGASSPGPGQVVVLAPESLQNSIGETLKALQSTADAKAGAGTAKQLQTSYWNIEAVPGAGADDPALAPIGAKLAEIRTRLGETHLRLVGHVSSVSSPGQTVSTSYMAADPTVNLPYIGQLQYSLANKPEGVLLDISLSDKVPHTPANGGAAEYIGTSFKTAIVMRLGETLVLSDNPAIAGSTKGDSAASARSTRFNVVRVEEITPPKS